MKSMLYGGCTIEDVLSLFGYEWADFGTEMGFCWEFGFGDEEH